MKARRVAGLRITNKPCMLAIIVLLVLPCGLTQQTDEHYIVEPTPALRLGEDDLTTVLLVNNDNRTEAHGRFLNVRPTVGVLTSTARTFIQEGVTTEYATQVLGTTLENGRLYAQLLKKSSRVLYDKENVITPSATAGGVVHTSIVGEGPHYHLFAQPKSLLQSHNDLVGDKDWQDVDDRIILEKNSFVGNTDYVGSVPRASQIVYPVKSASASEIGNREEIVALNKNFSTSRSTISSEAFRIKANKVQPAVDLPTFTVKNMFSPSGFSWESSPLEGTREETFETHSQVTVSEQRSPKLLYHQVLKDEHRQLSTITYYGFADFTTIVGDSVIVFSPSTSSDQVPLGHVTSIKGEATLGRQEASYVSNVAITITQDLIEPTFVVPMLSTDVSDLQVKPKDMRVRNEEELIRFGPPVQVEAEIEVTTVPQEEPKPVEVVSYEIQTSVEIPKEDTEEHTTLAPTIEENIATTLPPPTEEEEEEAEEHHSTGIEHEEEIILASSMSDVDSAATTSLTPEPSPVETTSRVMLSRPSDEEILRIYSSLASAEAAKKASDVSEASLASIAVETTTQGATEPTTEKAEIPEEKLTTAPTTTTTEEPIQPDVKIQGGATTIFFEDDPFLDFVSPSSTETVTTATQVYTQTSANTESSIPAEQVPSTSEAPEEEKTNQPMELETESVTEEVLVTEMTEPNIEATTTIPETDTEQDEAEKKPDAPVSEVVFKPIIKEIDENEQVEGCSRTSQVFLTQVPKTLTYYTTFFIPNEQNEDETSTSIETNIVPSFDIAQATKHYCIQPTQVVSVLQTTDVPVLERPSKPEESNVIDSNIEELPEATTPMMIVRENAEVTESSDIDASGAGYEDEEEEDEEEDEEESDSGEEIELIYKTLYTTYTYLTTFFHDATTSVSSRKEVVTNVITSSLGMDNIRSSGVADIQATATASNEVTPTLSVGIGRPTAKFVVQSSDLDKVESEADSLVKPTAQLDDSKLAKTYYTTYTYYTTIFVDGETEVMSRTEVHTNIIGKATDAGGSSHSARNLNIDDTVFDEDNAVIDIRPTATYDTIQRTAIASEVVKQEPKQIEGQLKYTTLNRVGVQELESSASSSSSRTEKKIVPIEDDAVKMVTDVRSSSSNGDHHLIENGVLEDQISSESNTDEILPSATLLLQTSFTTFTYYTTMYSSEATNVVSRLETVTNVVTETLQPTKTLSVEEATLPITYFTTFTYWTKLAKDGEITTLSREETVSNVVTPTLSTESSITPTLTSEQPVYLAEAASVESVSPSAQVDATALSGLEPTTYYTTYTYYTTSYAGDQTITDSRFETVTNVVTPTTVASAIPVSAVTEEVSKIEQPVLEAVPAEVKRVEPPKTLSYDYKTIVDAEGISTLYFKTELVATTIDGVSTEIASSTSTINIDEVKKALSTTTIPEGSESTRTYKTGLVRLIEGTKLSNHTTTIYQSKVIGTIIDQRYAQIIESTSSFIIEKTPAPVLNAVAQISATSTLSPTSVQPTAFIAASSSKAIESSIGDAAEQEIEQTHDEEEDENDSEEEDDESGRPRTRLSFQTKKKTFTPVIRPFASRNRPQFAPKRKNLLPSSATIITRSDFTPTITATPAIKSDSRGRFSSSRKVNSGLSSSGISGSSSQGGKRFGRPSKSSQFGGFGSSSRFPGSSRNSLQSSRVQGSSSNFGGFASSRRSGTPFRGGSSTNIRSFSSAYAGNSRQRIRPSSSLPYENAPNTAGYTTLSPDSGEEDSITQRYDSEEETDVTTENLRRNNNPLLRFRRPQVSRPPFQPGQRNAPSNQVSGRRNPLTPKPKTTTTTTTTTTTNRPRPRAFQRPPVGGIQNRARPQSNLFPPRRLFQPQNQAIDEEQKTSDDFQDNEDDESDSGEYESDDEGDEDEQDATNRRRRESFTKRLQIKKRSKRQANNFRNRFRRPLTTKPTTEDRVEEEETPSTVRSRASSRFAPRTHNLPTTTHSNSRAPPQSNGRSIRPTKPNSSSRAQFTLRESNTTPKLPSRPSTNFRRPVPNGGGRRTTTTASRPKAPRLKSYGSTVTESSHHTSPRGGKTPSSRSRSTARGRSRNDFVTDPAIPVFDGTITVTHTSPTEITIPVVNGKVTEYKNVVTSTTSIEVILPNQYTSIIGQNGASTLILNREETAVNANGANEVTQFILHESPTTSVIFTPTTIRGRKTSFAHVIPSTAYQVENVVSTMQAQLAANAPLANILLSQLLLGNIGLNQANLNPLLGLGATQAVSQVPGEPTTEYKTRTSTYVTTVTNEPDLNTNRQQLQQQNTHNLNAMFDSQHETPSINFSPISKPEPTESGRFFHFGSFDIGPPISSESTYPDDDNDDSIAGATGVAEEARYNLATRVMSNGVEVIIAGDKNGKGKPNALRILPSLSRKPMTLAPSTLKDQMILVMPSNAQENYTIPINSNHFITKTCLTTYTYRTTYLQDGKTTVESREKVVSNTATEERNYLKISPTESLGVTLSRTPELAVGVFHTTYTYYNTILDGDLPLVVSSQHVLTNTITGPDDYISFLQPSEEATPVLETNTYFSEISLTKTLKESDIEKIVSTSNILTQVIITESLPPRSTAVMTSYIAFDIDETSTQDIRPDISATDTQFHTYTYYNAEKNDSIQHTDDLQGNQNEKSYLYLKKDATPSLEKTSHSALTSTSKLQGSLQSDMHIYATKTYLTTFTYFTTLMNTLGNVASSTVVNFHTRVIENVITESIPSFMIDTDLLSKFETNLKNPKNHNSYITMVTLAGGQSLEITAMNMLHHPSPTIAKIQTTTDNTENDVAVKLEPTAVVSSAPAASITSPPAENSNEVLDSDVASSENEEQYIESETNFPKNNTKTAAATTDFPSVNQIIGSLNLNRLQALGPVFNAMAGLIQNNFGTNLSNDLKKNTSNANVESKHSAKNISAYDSSAQVHDGPIYIPVQNLHGNPDDINVAGYISPQSLHISPPDTDWFMDEKKNRGKPELSPGKPTYETPLLNGGIPISPGEVITANSDVIVGKPNGIQPRVPFNSKTSDASNALLPPPPFSYQFQYQQHPKQAKPNPSPIPLEVSYDKQMNFDGILKPPPLKPPPLQHQQQQQLQQHQQQQLQQQQIQQQQHQQQQNTKKLVPLNPNYNPNYRVHYATGHMHQPQHIPMQGHHHQQQQQQHHLQQRPNVQRPGHYNSAFQVNTNPRPISQKPNYIPYAPHDYDQPHPPNDKKNQLDLNQDLHNNEILEIKRIPEVYSTDLPGTEAGITSTSNSVGGGNYKTLIKKVINSDKPMLVDIKPSQITNIVIPRDNSASILIVESAVELHKNGQYYDEPTSYPDALVTGNVVAQVQPARKPILSNQQVNLDMNVLSHNVDINVPPLTFKKDSDFPHSTPVRGQIQKHEQTNFHMPHVTIPLSDNQIQVHLTPQNMITQQKVPGQFFNDIDSPHGSANDPADTLQALEPTRYTNPHSNTIQGKPQIYLHPAQDNKRRPYNNNRPQDHSYQYGKIHRPMSTLKGTGSTSAFPVPQFIGLPTNNKPPPQVIPLGNAAPKNPYKQRPHQEEYLQIFANVTPAKRPLKIDGPVQARPNFNPTPLLNLFYGSPNDGEEDLSGDFSQAPPPSKQGENYWQADSIQQDDEDEDATEESDQKAASSLNVGIPTQSQPTENESTQSQSQKPKPTHQSRTTPKPPSKAITQLDIKSPMIGTESYLDPASVSAVNNMGELDVQPSPTPNTPPTMMRPPSPGRPFTQNKPNVRPPQRVKNDQTIFINSGEGFKLQYDKEQNQSGFVQVSLPVDTKETESQQKDSNTQTEAPFNPKYTKRTKRPQKNPPQITTTITSSPASTPSRSPPSLNLNKLEVVGLSGGNQSNSAEIFDFHESMNPHNYDFVHIATEESTTLKETAYTSDPMTQRPGLTNLYPFVSEPSVNLKPPPVSTLPHTENVMGLNPPPPPTVPVSISTPHFTPSMSPPVTTYKTINVTAANRNPLLPVSHTTLRPIKLPTYSTKAPPPSTYSPSSTSRPRTRPAYSSINRPTASTVLKRRPPLPTAKTSSTPQQTAQPKTSTTHAPPSTPTVLESKTDSELDILPTLSTEVQEESPNAGNSRRPAHNDGKNGGTYEMPMFTLSQKIPDEILIEGSEEDHRRKPTIKIFENQTETTTMIRKHPILTDNHLQQSMSKPQPPLNHINTRTRITSRIIIPTKYVTNTHVLTVTTTKISVLTSLGIPSTQTFTLTKTKTSTLVDTVTETHTLLQPTRVTESHTTTATQIIHTDYHHPLASIQPTIEVVNPVPTNDESTDPPTRLPITTPSSTPNLDSNSIFVVMTDKKSHGGVFSISPSMIDTPQNINAIGGGTTGGGTDNDNSIELDYDDNIGFDLPARDEEAETNEVNHVLLGGVLIATPPKSSDSNHLGVPSTSCRPSCKASRNELCQQVDSRMLCVCRPGFARMFPDRPCRPTYTYAMQIPIYRVSKQVLHFKDQYRVRDSEDFKQLAGITHDAVDRMVMQSDLRDVYHGVHVTSFDATNSENGILGKFLIQLSDNSDEKRLVDVFKKYLRQNNFSLGGTEIFTTKNGVNSLEIVDFNECAHSQFHDCSENSRCFNLQGTYTCSCQEGFADLSENSIYPGRICSAEVIGCEKCHYHGKCVQMDKAIPPVCECFHWYTGASCQLNLKILLIALIAVGTILFILLLFCVLVTCTRRRKNHNMQSLMSGIHIIAPRNSRLSSKSLTTDKRAMIKDSSSEASQNSLPYVLKKDSKKQSMTRNKTPQQQQAPYRNINQRGHPSSTLVSSLSEVDHRHNYSEQNDRSLTVMIPRAKYHHSVVTQSAHQGDSLDHATHNNEPQQLPKTSTTESASKASTFHCSTEKIPSPPSKTSSSNHGALHTTSTGALVSAGFEVSATVGNIACQQMPISNSNTNLSSTYETSRGNQMPKLVGELHSRKSNYQDPHLQYNTYKDGEKFIDSMDVWLDTIQQNELTAEARSFDETTIQAPTKSLRSVYERQMSQSNGNDEANTMAERDIGSTFLLPHTHLYKPDRDSDVSGFDSF